MRLTRCLPVLLLSATPGLAMGQTSPAEPAPVPDESGIAAYFATWFDRVNAAQASQPHWMTPLFTVTPRLEEEIRYDQFWEHLPNGGSLHNDDTGKGLELIPTATNEVIIGVPPYIDRNVGGKPTNGWGDGPTILVKQRLFSENERSGDAIVTAFLAVTPSAGGAHFTQHAIVITPTIAGGKGWGPFDIQATSGFAIPTRRMDKLGTQWLTNVALQLHLHRYFWPEFEVNDTVWLDGKQRGGKNQVFLLPGIIFGRFDLGGRVHAAIGVGYQFAVSPKQALKPELDPVYEHNWILSARLSF